MALIKCVECGAEVSEHAEKCPKCGCPVEEITKEIKQNKKSKRKSGRKRKILIFLILFFIGITFSCSIGKEKFDCSGDIGKDYTEFTTLKFVEDEAYSIMFPDDPKIFEAKSEYEYEGIAGEMTYRYFDEDDFGYSANEIYYISWSPLEESNIGKSKINYILGWYEGYYGEYDSNEETSYGSLEYIEYVWNLENDIKFEISIKSDYSDLDITWMRNSES